MDANGACHVANDAWAVVARNASDLAPKREDPTDIAQNEDPTDIARNEGSCRWIPLCCHELAAAGGA